jgi:hypothetical protein
MNSYIQVFGCTENKVVYKIDMAVADVVRLRIHPWKLDLFEPEPIRGGMPHGIPLMFSPLQEISFAYTQGNQGFVSISHDGSVQNISGTVHTQGNGGMCMKRDQVEWSFDQGDFSKHFLNYLHYCDEARSINQETMPRLRCLAARDHTHMQLMNQLLVYSGGEFPSYCFAGKMFEPRYFRCSLPLEIERVFELFGRFHPVVFGPALTRVLCGAAIGNEEVDFIVDKEGPDYLQYVRQVVGAGFIEEMDAPYWKSRNKFFIEEKRINATGVCHFKLHGTNYRLFVADDNKLTNPRTWRRSDLSIYQSECEQPGVVIASRIALYDLARKQARLLGLYKQYQATVGGKRIRRTRDQLRLIGINAVDVLWGSRDGHIINRDAVPDGIPRHRERRGRHDYP